MKKKYIIKKSFWAFFFILFLAFACNDDSAAIRRNNEQHEAFMKDMEKLQKVRSLDLSKTDKITENIEKITLTSSKARKKRAELIKCIERNPANKLDCFKVLN